MHSFITMKKLFRHKWCIALISRSKVFAVPMNGIHQRRLTIVVHFFLSCEKMRLYKV